MSGTFCYCEKIKDIARRYLVASLFLLTGLGWMPVNGATAESIIYLSLSGSDNNNGKTQESAVATLQRAFDIAYAVGRSDRGTKIRINIASGHYIGQIVKVRRPPPDTEFEITATPGSKSKPIFDGGGQGGTWFTLKANTQRGARFLFRGLEITRYMTAMSFEGDRERADSHIGGNVIQGMVFRKIGQISTPNGQPSQAGIRFVNSRNNIIRDNEFIEIRNKKCKGLHVLYFAHHSSDNQITGNVFDGACDSPIRLRDESNNNIATKNLFKNIRFKAIFDEWYCDREKFNNCTKKSPECPSWNNRYENNQVENSADLAMTEPTAVHVPDIAVVCQAQKSTGAEEGRQRMIRR